MWLKVESFVDKVRLWWNGCHFVGPLSYVLACKLKALKGDLKHWNKYVFGEVAFIKKSLLTKLLDIDMRDEMQVLTQKDRARRLVVKSDIDYLASLEEISWRQMSKALFIKEGDNNTRFFHRIANSHRNQKLWRPTIDRLEFTCLDEIERSMLERKFEEEIIEALMEAEDSRLKSGNPGVIVKLDIEKTYDHVNWNAIFYLMEMMGFGARWSGLIKACISTVKFSVLVNGAPVGFFGSSCGLCQGDPLSPLLFLLVMEVLSRLLKRTENGGFLCGFQAGSHRQGCVHISHLLFAEGTILFCDASREQLLYIQMVLIFFEAITGLKVNEGKSEIVPVGDVGNLNALARAYPMLQGGHIAYEISGQASRGPL
ncbi:uncharacterized protein LOC126719389 [Quercus robur]|uniref:uncharacterized protein LOC126719389 n=1 Tax=Quercus robur TaxID=38942 RepID=UPI002162BE24|nr:uncharacterized protein LOC126719389 [Quercus robur]